MSTNKPAIPPKSELAGTDTLDRGNTNAKLQIQSITMVTVASTQYARVVVTTDKPSVVTPLKNINGTLRYCTTDTLGSAFSPIAAIDVWAAEGATATVDIPTSAGKFVKITLQ